MSLVSSSPKTKLGTRLQNLSVTTRIIGLCVGLSAAIVITLTVIGYQLAADGLREQAQATLASDALVVANTVDQWNTNRLEALQTLASLPAFARFLEASPTTRASLMATVQDSLTSVDALAADMDSVAVMDPTGTFIASSNPKDLGSNVAQRDYFQTAMQGKTFITGVSISTITNAPSLFHSAPIKNAEGKVIGAIRSRSSLEFVIRAVHAARNRVGAGGAGILLDQDGLVIANSVNEYLLNNLG